MKTYKLIHKSGKTVIFTIFDGIAYASFSGGKSQRMPIEKARRMYRTMAAKDWNPEKVEAALIAIAKKDIDALIDWLKKYDKDFVYSPRVRDNILWVAGLASAETFDPANVRMATLRAIRHQNPTIEQAAQMARAVL